MHVEQDLKSDNFFTTQKSGNKIKVVPVEYLKQYRLRFHLQLSSKTSSKTFTIKITGSKENACIILKLFENQQSSMFCDLFSFFLFDLF